MSEIPDLSGKSLTVGFGAEVEQEGQAFRAAAIRPSVCAMNALRKCFAHLSFVSGWKIFFKQRLVWGWAPALEGNSRGIIEAFFAAEMRLDGSRFSANLKA
jgi:hypothetical protein